MRETMRAPTRNGREAASARVASAEPFHPTATASPTLVGGVEGEALPSTCQQAEPLYARLPNSSSQPVMTQHFWLSNVRNDTIGGLVSALIAIPLAMGFGMFAFVSLGDEYFANGALAGLCTALIVGLASVLLGDKTSIVYAPRVNSTFFIGALRYGLVHSEVEALRSASLSLTLVVFFSIILLGGAFQVLFGLIRLGTLIKFAPHPVMAGYQGIIDEVFSRQIPCNRHDLQHINLGTIHRSSNARPQARRSVRDECSPTRSPARSCLHSRNSQRP
jgi:hypothetical protein